MGEMTSEFEKGLIEARLAAEGERLDQELRAREELEHQRRELEEQIERRRRDREVQVDEVLSGTKGLIDEYIHSLARQTWGREGYGYQFIKVVNFLSPDDPTVAWWEVGRRKTIRKHPRYTAFSTGSPRWEASVSQDVGSNRRMFLSFPRPRKLLSIESYTFQLVENRESGNLTFSESGHNGSTILEEGELRNLLMSVFVRGPIIRDFNSDSYRPRGEYGG